MEYGELLLRLQARLNLPELTRYHINYKSELVHSLYKILDSPTWKPEQDHYIFADGKIPPYIKSDRIIIATYYERNNRSSGMRKEVYYTTGWAVMHEGKYYKRERLGNWSWINWEPILDWFNRFSDTRTGIFLGLSRIMSQDLMNLIEEYLYDWEQFEEHNFVEYTRGN